MSRVLLIFKIPVNDWETLPHSSLDSCMRGKVRPWVRQHRVVIIPSIKMKIKNPVSKIPTYSFLSFFLFPFLKLWLRSMWSLTQCLPSLPHLDICLHLPDPKLNQSTVAAMPEQSPNSKKGFTASFFFSNISWLPSALLFSLDITGLTNSVAWSRQEAEYTPAPTCGELPAMAP